MRRAVFLDRDGVINRAIVRDNRPHAPLELPAFEILPDVGEALELLSDEGFLTVVVTNQPDVAARHLTMDVLEAMHDRMRDQLPIDDVRVCPHAEADGCPCRKPRPGMVLDAAAAWGIDLAGSFVIGVRWRDIELGRGVGCTTVLVGDGYGEAEMKPPDRSVGSLLEAARWIIAHPAVPARQ